MEIAQKQLDAFLGMTIDMIKKDKQKDRKELIKRMNECLNKIDRKRRDRDESK